MYSEQLLKEIEGFAYSYLSKQNIALITGVILDELEDDGGPIMIAFYTGRLKRKAEFNNEVIALSKQLSSVAMNIEAKLAEQSRLEDMGI